MAHPRDLLKVAFGAHVVIGLVVIVGVLVSSPWVIGAGRFEEVVRQLEDQDWRWLVLVPAALVWGLPIVAVLSANQARRAGLEAVKLRDVVRQLLKDRQLPIAVDVNAKVPVRVEEPMRIPVEIDTRMSVDETIEIETLVPVRTDLPLDTEIETSVFGVGKLKIPVKARIPIDFDLPIRGRIRVRSEALPVRIKDEVVAHLPEFVVPIRSRLETRVDLLESLRAAEGELFKGRKKALPEGAEGAPPDEEDAVSP